MEIPTLSTSSGQPFSQNREKCGTAGILRKSGRVGLPRRIRNWEPSAIGGTCYEIRPIFPHTRDPSSFLIGGKGEHDHYLRIHSYGLAVDQIRLVNP